MQMFDPQRPRLSGKPCYIGYPGVLPNINIAPSEKPDTVTLMVFVPTGWNQFAPRWTEVNPVSLYALLQMYRDDPEDFLETYFKVDRSIMVEGVFRPPAHKQFPAPKAMSPELEAKLASLNLEDLL